MMMGSAAAAATEQPSHKVAQGQHHKCHFVAAEPDEIKIFATGERVKIRR